MLYLILFGLGIASEGKSQRADFEGRAAMRAEFWFNLSLPWPCACRGCSAGRPGPRSWSRSSQPLGEPCWGGDSPGTSSVPFCCQTSLKPAPCHLNLMGCYLSRICWEITLGEKPDLLGLRLSCLVIKTKSFQEIWPKPDWYRRISFSRSLMAFSAWLFLFLLVTLLISSLMPALCSRVVHHIGTFDFK